MSEVTEAIRDALAGAIPLQPAASYFGTSARPADGLLAGCVVTAYRSGRDPDVQELLVRRHEAYVECLRLGGIRVPQAELHLIDAAGSQQLVSIQRAVEPQRMMSTMLRSVPAATAIDLLDRVAGDVAEFWRRVAQRPERIGLHAQVDRFGLDDDGPLFVDTFPPLISYDRESMGQVIHRFADGGLIRGITKILPGRVRDLQDRWYSTAGSLSTLIDGALRLRPSDQALIIGWAEDFAARRLDEPVRAAVSAHLRRHVRQSTDGVRRWGGLVGGRDRPHAG